MKKKRTSRERRAEERRILAEMDEAMKEIKNTESSTAASSVSEREYDDTMPQKMHCKRCKTLMENGVCPTCGFTVYVPMSDAKRKRIRRIAWGVGLLVAVVCFLIIQSLK